MDAFDALLGRRSTGRLVAPAPTPEQLERILLAGAAAPDHGTLRPWRFIVLEGEGQAAFGSVLAEAYERRCAASGTPVDLAALEKERTKLGRAPTVVVAACAPVLGHKVPVAEQVAAVDAAAQNVLLAATALGFGSMWRTGDPVRDPHVKAALRLDEHAVIVGFLYLGTVGGAAPPPNAPTLDGVVTRWAPPG